MTCKECIHEKVCDALIKSGCPYLDKEIPAEAFCLEFRNTADVVPKSEEGAECPTCHGTGRIGTTDWLTKNISKKQLAEEKAQAIAEHEQHIKTEVAREIFEGIGERLSIVEGHHGLYMISEADINELKRNTRRRITKHENQN